METIEEKIAYIMSTREDVMKAADQILGQRMAEYADKFGWDVGVDGWLWQGMNDCGTGYLIAVGSSTNCAKRSIEDDL